MRLPARHTRLQAFFTLLTRSLAGLVVCLTMLSAPAAHAIVGGYIAPDLAGQVQVWEAGILQCSGSLIGTTWVLTAAHCIQPPNGTQNSFVILGDRRAGVGQTFTLRQIVVNPSADIALLQLDGSARPEQVVAYGQGIVPVNRFVTIRGWGATVDNGNDFPPVLKMAGMKVAMTSGAVAISPPSPDGTVMASVDIFLGHTAGGDSGAGLLYHGQICGVHAAGFLYADPQYPLGVFASAAVQTDWLAPWIFANTHILPSLVSCNSDDDSDPNVIHPPLRVMPLGDQFAVGNIYNYGCQGLLNSVCSDLKNGYRGYLQNSLDRQHETWQFSGSRLYGTLADAHTEGYGNWTIQKVDNNLIKYVNSKRPNVVTVTVGHEDVIYTFTSIQDCLARMDKLVRDIFAADPGVTVILTPIPSLYGSGVDGAYIDQFNAGLGPLTADYQQRGFHLLEVDNHPLSTDNWSGQEILDKAGFEKVGTGFDAGIFMAIELGWLSAPATVSTSCDTNCGSESDDPSDNETNHRGSGGSNGGGSTGGGGTAGGGSCDIYASGGTPCVAAHSTVRALFGGYSGRLYQVKRASDGSTTDINTSSTGGYAKAATQDSFCAGTTCTITIIYDQTSRHNDLAIEGPGGTVKTADSGASANALPIGVHGNDVYGIKVTPGVGYRNNATSGVASGGSPEGMYMVTSGTYVNNGCCFDYGNAETSGNDTGNGHMDTINFGTACIFGPCSGSGPWVEADLENGQYMGNGSNLGNQSIGSDFVTAMLKNNGQTTFALKGGNAQSGGLTTEYAGSLPTINPGYTPMSLEGAIVLGTGGDNSNWGLGSFFEGAMTSGYPSDAVESAVQANIVAAGYTGNSGGNGGSSGGNGSHPDNGGSVYAGPNDPGGPGPQDGFASPAIQQPDIAIGSKPALASFNGSLYVAFQANDPVNELWLTTSSDGSSFTKAIGYPNIRIGSAPAMAAFNNQLFVAFQANDPVNELWVTSSSDGSSFTSATGYPNILMGGAPAMTVFNSKLYLAFQANDAGHTLHVTSSSDGQTWPAATQVSNVAIGSAPAMTVFNGKLYIAFRADDPSNAVWIASSSDGVNFSSQRLSSQSMGGSSSPALVVSNNTLYYIYGADDTSNEMLVTTSTDGSTWQGPAAYLDIKMGAAGPGAAAFGNGVYVGLQTVDSRNALYVTHKVTEASVYTGPNDPGGPGPQDGFASPAAQLPNIYMGSKPALTYFNKSLYVAFQANDAGHTLQVTSSSDGRTWPAASQKSNIQIGSAPTMAALNDRLFVAFQANDPIHELWLTSSSDGSSFTSATGYPNIRMGSAPAMVAFNNALYVAFQANDPGHTLHVVSSSSDGQTWPAATQVSNIAIGGAPAMAVFNGKLYVAFRADDPSNAVWIASSSDGVHFSSQVLSGQTMGGSSVPALTVLNNTLYCIYGANDISNEMLVTASTDGSTWQGPAAYLDVKMGAAGPAASAFGNGVYVGFQSNDSRKVLFMTRKVIAGLGF